MKKNFQNKAAFTGLKYKTSTLNAPTNAKEQAHKMQTWNN